MLRFADEDMDHVLGRKIPTIVLGEKREISRGCLQGRRGWTISPSLLTMTCRAIRVEQFGAGDLVGLLRGNLSDLHLGRLVLA